VGRKMRRVNKKNFGFARRCTFQPLQSAIPFLRTPERVRRGVLMFA